MRDHPGLRVQLSLSDAGLEVGEDGFDVALRVGLPDELGLVARKLAISPCVVVAAPAYVARRGAPSGFEDLARHDCLILARRKRLANIWTFLRDGQEHHVTVSGPLASGSGEALHVWARAEAGISFEALWDVEEDLESGALVDLLPRETPKPIELYATFLSGKPIAPRVRLFVIFSSPCSGVRRSKARTLVRPMELTTR